LSVAALKLLLAYRQLTPNRIATELVDYEWEVGQPLQ
jgi:hypothetical protein